MYIMNSNGLNETSMFVYILNVQIYTKLKFPSSKLSFISFARILYIPVTFLVIFHFDYKKNPASKIEDK